ncbi:MAG: hypothetical protein QXF12_07810 [Candidatus Aenigmatarchaeota archaeon]
MMIDILNDYEKFLESLEKELRSEKKVIDIVNNNVENENQNNDQNSSDQNSEKEEDDSIISDIIYDQSGNLKITFIELNIENLKKFSFCYNEELTKNECFGNGNAVFNFSSEKEKEEMSDLHENYIILSNFLTKEGFRIVNGNYGIYNSPCREEAEKKLMELGLRKDDDLIRRKFST